MSLRDRFEAKVSPEPTSGCWLWTGAIMSTGYGWFQTDGRKPARAHRIAYELDVGPIPDGLVLDHQCHNRACVNPSHLRPVTTSQNNRNLRGKTSGQYTSRHTGVSWHASNHRWQATIKVAGRKRHLGYFADETAAAEAYRSAQMSLETHRHAGRDQRA